MDINKKIAVITGASSGLGAALANALIKKGATVYGIARNTQKLMTLQETLGFNFKPVTIDVAKQNAIEQWALSTFSQHHSPSILINNAGVGYLKKMADLSLPEWHAMVNTNLNGTFYVTSIILPFLKENGEGAHIINVGSILGKTTNSESAAYSATKYAMQGFSEALFKELRGDNIKVTCVNPGSIDTQFFEESGVNSHDNMLQPSEVATLLVQILETPENLLIDEITLRPLNPSKK